MRRNFNFSVSEFYHLYNRGNDKRIIFKDGNDYARFVVLLHLLNNSASTHINDLFPRGRSSGKNMNSKVIWEIKIDEEDRLVDIGAYCLMSNHFHLLVREKEEGGISKFMKKLSTGYVMYFNKKYERTGGLFEGRFKATHINKDNHLKYLFSYIHLNPVKFIDPKWKEKGISDKEKIRKYLGNYKYSSYPDYIGQERSEAVILNRQVFPKYFNNNLDFSDFINFWLNFNKEKF